MVGTCDVANTAGCLVSALTPAAQVKHSKPSPLKLVEPPKPFQRPTGTTASKPISSAMRSIADIVAPPLRLLQKVPSFSLLSLKSGLLAARNWSALPSAFIFHVPSFVFCFWPARLILDQAETFYNRRLRSHAEKSDATDDRCNRHIPGVNRNDHALSSRFVGLRRQGSHRARRKIDAVGRCLRRYPARRPIRSGLHEA